MPFQYPANYAEQRYYGPMWDEDPISKNLWQTGSLNPTRRLRELQFHGRALTGVPMNGLGGPTYRVGGDSKYNDSDATKAREEMDDVYGSGIFDEGGRGPTVNPELGIFGDNPSIPGFIGREVQFAVSTEVADANGRPIVVVPGGGLFYAEQRGKPVDPQIRGPVPPKPPWAPSVPTGRMQPYARTTGRRNSTPSHPTTAGLIPAVQDVSIFAPQYSKSARLVPYESTTRYVPAYSGLGADVPSTTPGWGTYAVAGAIVGAAAALFMGTMRPARR